MREVGRVTWLKKVLTGSRGGVQEVGSYRKYEVVKWGVTISRRL